MSHNTKNKENTTAEKKREEKKRREKDANNPPSTEQAVKTKPKQDKSFSFIFHRF